MSLWNTIPSTVLAQQFDPTAEKFEIGVVLFARVIRESREYFT